MAQSKEPKLWLTDHPVSSYAQKVRIALREKGVHFTRTAAAPGQGGLITRINPREEVPVLHDSDPSAGPSFDIFDSTVILEYLEDRFPEPALLPKNDPRARALARMIEEVCDTQYEAVNWGYAETLWFDRGKDEGVAERLREQAVAHTAKLQSWLEEKLADKDHLASDTFGWADLAAAPIVNRSVYYGLGPKSGSPLEKWFTRVSARPSVKETFKEFEEGVAKVPATKDIFRSGKMKREYRDHRIEWMIKAGGIDVVTAGLRDNNIRFSWPNAD